MIFNVFFFGFMIAEIPNKICCTYGDYLNMLMTQLELNSN